MTSPVPESRELESAFRDPAPENRPLQIVHGMDVFVGADGAPGLEGIDRTLHLLKDRGVGGIVTNVSFRDYMRDPRQWDILRHGLAAAKELGLTVWLYDEDGYPSGAAGGLVLEGHPELEALGLACMTIRREGPGRVEMEPPDCLVRFVSAVAHSGARILGLSSDVDGPGRLDATLPEGSWTVSYFFEKAAYEGTHAQGNVHASRRYINVLEPDAVKRFVAITHEAYERALGPGLGGAKAFFTDEPSLMSSYIWPLPPNIEGTVRIQDPLRFRDRTPMVAWSRRFPQEFQKRKGYDIMPLLPDLFADRDARSRTVREDYREVVGDLFAEAYFGTIGRWCEARGLDSSGRVLVEESLLWHVALLGDLFVLARRMSYPGIDMLDADPRSIVAGEGFMVPKQVSSAAHLAGRRRVMSESSDWFQRNEGRAASAAELRGQSNLQFLLGVTTITSYHDWKGRGDAYTDFLDHAGRLNVMLTAGHHDARTAVLYPVRAVGGRYLPQSDPPLPPTQPPDVQAMVAGWTDTCRALLRCQVDFDCIDEKGLAEGRVEGGALRVGDEYYQTIVIPPADRLSDASCSNLGALVAAGGRLVTVRDPAVGPIHGLPTGPASTTVESPSGLRALAGVFIPRTMRLRPDSQDVFCVRHVIPGGSLYFIVNASAASFPVEASFDESGECRLWDPRTGVVQQPRRYGAQDWLPLTIEGDGSLFVTFSSGGIA